ncbi:hypothetical protein [Luteipulveratus halotolerans]|nr:hypothetical protein [Luteipulveratus halotolerans]
MHSPENQNQTDTQMREHLQSAEDELDDLLRRFLQEQAASSEERG